MRKLNTALFAAFLGCTAIISPALAETTNITFLLTNDIYKVDNDSRARRLCPTECRGQGRARQGRSCRLCPCRRSDLAVPAFGL